MQKIKEINFKYKFIDGKELKDKVDEYKVKLLGPKDERDDEIERNLKNSKKKDNKKDNNTENKSKKENIILKDIETNEKLSTCIGREISLALNSKEIRETHEEKFGKKVYTRFPPEPNG